MTVEERHLSELNAFRKECEAREAQSEQDSINMQFRMKLIGEDEYDQLIADFVSRYGKEFHRPQFASKDPVIRRQQLREKFSTDLMSEDELEEFLASGRDFVI